MGGTLFQAERAHCAGLSFGGGANRAVESESMTERSFSEPTGLPAWRQGSTILDREAESRSRRAYRTERAKTELPRLRAIGYLGLWALVGAHNALVFGDPLPQMLALLAATFAVYFIISKLMLVAYYDPDARLDLSDVFLAGDIGVFLMAVYASGGERSWMLPVLCMRVADQVGTSQRRALSFGVITALGHGVLVLYLHQVEQRSLDPVVEYGKVLLVFVCNCYLALATKPNVRQRERATRMAEDMRELIETLQEKGVELEQQRERAESASRAKSAFLANMSHEIRTPLTAVLGMTDLLLRQRLEPGQREIVETVQLAGKSLHALVNDVLDMSKVESGKLELHLGDVDIRHLVQSAAEPLRVLAEAKGLALRLEMEGLGERKVRADALRVRQVISNLVGNAIKFTQRGTVDVRVLGRVSRVSDPRWLGATPRAGDAPALRVRFEVQDTGIGIANEAATRVFEAFQQADASTTRNYGGTGLGLTISRKLVEMMGGELVLTSVPGQGSTFAFELDLLLASESLRPVSGRVRASHGARLRELAPHVLVVEDIEVNRMLLQDVLQSLGCRVTSVEHGQSALNALEPAHDFDVIVMDWHMPVLDGVEATLRARSWERAQRRKRVPIIGFTASAFADDVARCKQAGMDHVLHKPLVRSELEEALWECLGITSEVAETVV
jgi:signal transduction histidine kinase